MGNLDITGLHFPTPLIITYLKHDESILKTTQSNWLQFDCFVTKANQAWLNTIEQVYEFETQYEWENYWVEYRRKLLIWCQHTYRVLEYVTDLKKLNPELKLWEQSRNELIKHKKREKSLRYDDEYFPKSDVPDETSKMQNYKRN